MTNRDRVRRYKTEGAAADLVRVKVLVPPEARDQVVTLAQALRKTHRANRGNRPDGLDPIRRFRADVEAAFRGRVRDLFCSDRVLAATIRVTATGMWRRSSMGLIGGGKVGG